MNVTAYVIETDSSLVTRLDFPKFTLYIKCDEGYIEIKTSYNKLLEFQKSLKTQLMAYKKIQDKEKRATQK